MEDAPDVAPEVLCEPSAEAEEDEPEALDDVLPDEELPELEEAEDEEPEELPDEVPLEEDPTELLAASTVILSVLLVTLQSL